MRVIGLPVGVAIFEDLHVAGPGDSDTAFGVGGDREDIVRQIVAGEACDLEAVGDFDAGFARSGGTANRQDAKNKGGEMKMSRNHKIPRRQQAARRRFMLNGAGEKHNHGISEPRKRPNLRQGGDGGGGGGDGGCGDNGGRSSALRR